MDPSNASIDALFANALSAHVSYVEEPGELADFAHGELASLRDALRIHETGEQFHCMCMGTLKVELRDRASTLGAITYHHGQSLRMKGWSSDAWLIDGPALARILEKRGVPGPLREIEEQERQRQLSDVARREWLDATPFALRSSLRSIESDPMGLPAQQTNDRLKEIVDGLSADRARTLLKWLSAGRGPWSGYASYEDLPMKLLRVLPNTEVHGAIDASLNERERFAAARHLASHHIVTFDKKQLADVPIAIWDLLAPAVAALGTSDDRVRWDHAVRVAAQARAARIVRAPYAVGDGCTVFGTSLSGPLSGLGVCSDSLISCDVKTILRFDPASVIPTVLAEASEHFVVLAASRRVWYGTMNHGEVFVLEGDRPVRIASEQKVPVEMSAHGDRVAWFNRDGHAIAISSENGVRTIAVQHAWSLALGREHVFWMKDGWNGPGEIVYAAIETGEIKTLAKIESFGHSMGTPRVVFSEGELWVAMPDRVIAIDRNGQSRQVAKSNLPIRAMAIDDGRIALLIGKDDKPWSFAVIDNGKTRELGSFSRAPYFRHALVIARDQVCTTVGDRILGASIA